MIRYSYLGACSLLCLIILSGPSMERIRASSEPKTATAKRETRLKDQEDSVKDSGKGGIAMRKIENMDSSTSAITPSVRFAPEIRTRYAFDLYHDQILHQVFEAKGSIVVPRSDKFLLTQLMLKRHKDVAETLRNSGNCDLIEGDPNSYVKLHGFRRDEQKNGVPEASETENDQISIDFSVINFNYTGYFPDTINLLRLSTSSGKTVYSSGYMSRENRSKHATIVLVGRERDIAKYTFDYSHTPYEFQGKQYFTKYFGTIDSSKDDCGGETSAAHSCNYEFVIDGIRIKYEIYFVSQKPMIFVDSQGTRSYYFFPQDQIVARRFASKKGLECRSQVKLPNRTCQETRKLWKIEEKTEDQEAGQFDYYRHVSHELDCESAIYLECRDPTTVRYDRKYEQIDPVVLKASQLDLKQLEFNSKALCVTSFESSVTNLADLRHNVNFNQLDYSQSISLMRVSSSGDRIENFLVEYDYHPERLECSKVGTKQTLFGEVWLECSLPISHKTDYYDLHLMIANEGKWNDTPIDCHHRSCSSKVYYFRYSAERKLWQIRLRGSDLKGDYRLWLDYRFKVNGEVKQPAINDFKININATGISNEYFTVFIVIIVILASLIVLSTIGIVCTFDNVYSMLCGNSKVASANQVGEDRDEVNDSDDNRRVTTSGTGGDPLRSTVVSK